MGMIPPGGGFISHTPPSNISSASNASIDKLLKTHPPLKGVLEALGVDISKISHFTKQPGAALDSLKKNMQEIQLVHVQNDHLEALKALGLGSNIEMALVMSSETEINRIKKKNKDIKESRLDKQKLSQISSLLGLDGDPESLLIMDTQGGVSILKSAFEEIEESLK